MARVKRRTLKKRGNMRKTRRQRKLSRKTMLRKRVRGGVNIKVKEILHDNDYLNQHVIMRPEDSDLYFIPKSESVSDITILPGSIRDGEKINIEQFDKNGKISSISLLVFKNSDDKVITFEYIERDKVKKTEKESGVETIGQLVVGKLYVPTFTRIRNYFNPKKINT